MSRYLIRRPHRHQCRAMPGQEKRTGERLESKGASPSGCQKKVGTQVPSTLAKLYKRRHEFVGHKIKLRFVSNSSLKVPSTGKSLVNSTESRLSDLTLTQQADIKKAIATQLSIPEGSVDLTDVILHRTNLPLGEAGEIRCRKVMDLS